MWPFIRHYRVTITPLNSNKHRHPRRVRLLMAFLYLTLICLVLYPIEKFLGLIP